MTEKLRWNPTVHAVRRIKERCGIDETQAKAFVNQIMASAKYVTTQADGNTVYKHEKRDIMIVADTDKNTVITIHSATQTPTGAPADIAPIKSSAQITIDRIAKAVQREFNRMKTQLSREVRKLSEQQAQLNVQIAELSLNKIRCYHPGTQALIQSRIDAFSTQVNELASEIEAKLAEIQKATEEVKAVVGE